jgi:hypothetical protein
VVFGGVLLFSLVQESKPPESYAAAPLATRQKFATPVSAAASPPAFAVSAVEGGSVKQPKNGALVASDATKTEQELERMMDAAMQRYLYLNTEDGLEALREMVRLRDKLLAQGHSPQDSLQMAIEAVAPLHDPSRKKNHAGGVEP